MFTGVGVGVVVVAIATVAAVPALSRTSGIGTLATGSGTATIGWVRTAGGVDPPPTQFSGTIAGLSVSGAATASNPSNVSNTPEPGTGTTPTIPSVVNAAKWAGTFGGTSFRLAISADFSSGSSVGSFAFEVTGTYGSRPVSATATIDPSNQNVIDVHGAAGDLKLTGTVTDPGGNSTTLHAAFNVSS